VNTEEGPHHDCVLVRYGELALKSRKVRARFTAQLKEFIIGVFHEAGLDCVVEDDGGHLYVFSSDLPTATDRLTRVFGVVSVSPATRVQFRDLEGLSADVAAYARHVLEPGTTFAVRARRTGQHPFSSVDLGREAGSAVWRAFDGDLEVDLDDPDGEVHVEVRDKVAYIYHQRLQGVGGLPLGSQGRVLCPLRDPRDAVAGWMMMRRGCELVVLVPEGDWGDGGGEGDGDGEGDGRPGALVRTLRDWDPGLRVRSLPEGEWDWPAIYREMGMSRSLAVVSGERGPDVPRLPPDRDREPVVFFPLVGLDDGAYSRLEALVMG
jgi:thiamine biosynthesis protein ThiI